MDWLKVVDGVAEMWHTSQQLDYTLISLKSLYGSVNNTYSNLRP